MTLYVVATPIGNVDDLSVRAKKILESVQTVACEDTRHTGQLLMRLGLHKRLVRYDRFVHRREAPRLLEQLRRGEDLALVSDAGTPAISDPGWELVRDAVAEGIPIVSVPGPCSVATLLAGSGFPADRFLFLGFLPRRPGRIKKEFQMAGDEQTVVFFESARRIQKTLELARGVFGEVPAVVGRELTKVHEEWIRGSVGEVLEKLSAKDKLLGEVTAAVAPQLKTERNDSEEKIVNGSEIER